MILVIGDEIIDTYQWGTVTRVCPEAPVPVFVPTHSETRPGGAALVAANLRSLSDEPVETFYGGHASRKLRYMVGHHLLMRVDRDADSKLLAFDYDALGLAISRANAIVICDYGKGAINDSDARFILDRSAATPIFADAKRNPDRWRGVFASFPNEHESAVVGAHVIRKLGPRGCLVDDVHVPAAPRQVYDVTGAGDVFIAAFVADYLRSRDLIHAAKSANLAAGASVERLGTCVVSPDDLR